MTDDTTSKRPAEQTLITQLQKERESVLDGFASRKAVLRWGQRIAVRALGQIPQERFHQLAQSFRPDESYQEGPMLAAFLHEGVRTREMSDDAVEGIRERWAADVLGPTQVRSFRDLRKDAGEYIGGPESDADSGTGYDPGQQEIAMRPALGDLDTDQAAALNMVIDGLGDKTEILVWGDHLTQATRGEPVDPEREPGAFVRKCYHEPSTVELLTDKRAPYQRAREAFLAHWLLPAFNRGVRDLTRRTAEEPKQTNESGLGDTPNWR